jgi:hypothetical protein
MLCSDRDAAVADLKTNIEAETNEIVREQDRLPGLGPTQREQMERQIAGRQQMINNMQAEIRQLYKMPCD